MDREEAIAVLAVELELALLSILPEAWMGRRKGGLLDRENAIEVLADELDFLLSIWPAAWLGRVVTLVTFLL